MRRRGRHDSTACAAPAPGQPGRRRRCSPSLIPRKQRKRRRGAARNAERSRGEEQPPSLRLRVEDCEERGGGGDHVEGEVPTFCRGSYARPRSLQQLSQAVFSATLCHTHRSCRQLGCRRGVMGRKQRHQLAAVRGNGCKGWSRHAGQEEQGGVEVLLLPATRRCSVAQPAHDRRCEAAHAHRVDGR